MKKNTCFAGKSLQRKIKYGNMISYIDNNYRKLSIKYNIEKKIQSSSVVNLFSLMCLFSKESECHWLINGEL